jgi:2-polyprenyl-3-methyl-5-hydroxy-6-metoxy-1,4-benzoquinol methylase
MDFSRRSYNKELLDAPGIPFEDISQNMIELDLINRYLGGHRITLSGFKALAGECKELTICEIGCGGGDNLLAIKKFAEKKNIRIRLIGIDINAHCIDIARKKFEGTESKFLVSDYQLIHFGDEKPDIVFSSLFCHHFTEPELKNVFDWMRSNAGIGFFINDLHRHPLAYHSIKLLTRAFSKSYLVKNDAPLSVLRGFSGREWKELMEQSSISRYLLSWKWAFRWLLVVRLNY